MIVKGYRLGPLLKQTGRQILKDNVPAMAAQTAYFFFFSLFPLLLFTAPLLSLLLEREAMVRFVMDQMQSVVPAAGQAPLEEVLRNIVFTGEAPALVSIGILLAAWSGSRIFGALMDALNTAYDVGERRPWWKRQLLRLFMLLVGGVVVISATVVMLAGEKIAGWVGSLVGLAPAAIAAWNAIQFPLAFLFLVLFAFLTYWLLPNLKQRKSYVLVAAVVTSVLWLGATMLFRLYIQHFPPNPAYGAIGGIMILLTWMYFTMFIVLAGGELGAELHNGSGRIEPPKGATYFGRIVSGEEPGRPSSTSAA